MLHSEISFEEIQLSSQLVRDLIAGKESATQFVNLPFQMERIPDQIGQKAFSLERRKILSKVLVSQYHEPLHSAVKANIDQLEESNTYTITTGHQLNVLSGPLYSIYKIAQVISLSRNLNQQYPDYHFVPVFWMASEDHDYEEINHINLFGKQIKWERETSSKAVGRLDMSGCDDFFGQVEELYQNPEMKEKVLKLMEPYKEAANMSEATRGFIQQLFDEYGLVIIDGDNKDLKEQMIPAFQKEVREGVTERAVIQSNTELESNSYHQQVYVRECNLFHLDESGVRTRIDKEGTHFKFGKYSLTVDELSQMIEDRPEQFSPNALLRPLFQETILPNLVYTGGGGEIAYWMQLKGVFEAFDVTYPMVRVRDSYILLNEKDLQLMEDRGLSLSGLKDDMGVIEKELVLEEVGGELDLTEEKALFSQLKDSLKERAGRIESGLTNSVEAELTKMEKFLGNIESKMLKAEKRKHEVGLKKVEKLREKIYPNRGFQERYENAIPYLMRSDNFIEFLIELKLYNSPIIKIIRN